MPQKDTSTTVHIIDYDNALKDLILEVLTANGYRAVTYASALDFLSAVHRDLEGCIVTDVRMPEMSGIDLMTRLAEAGVRLPVIVVTGSADVHLAVEAMKLGAVDFLENPFQSEQLLAAIRGALRAGLGPSPEVQLGRGPVDLRGLSHREVEVLRLIGSEFRNREIARKLGIAERTVEARKANIVRKTGAKSLADLHRIARKLSDPNLD
jgi:two-component system response regulator FixJ